MGLTKTRPLEVEWEKEYGSPKGKIKDDGGTIEVSGFQGTYHITLSVPEGGTWKLGEQKGKTQPVYTLIDLPIQDRIGGYSFEELKAFDPKASLELTLADGRAGSVALPPVDVSYMVEEMLKKAENGPVKFGEEAEDAKQKDSLIWPEGLIGEHFLGKAGKLSELDWVLVAHKLPDEKGSKVCTGYTDSSGNAMPNLTLSLKETEATIYDRRTGDVVEKKLFAPVTECPMFTFRSEGETGSDSDTPYQPIMSWARSRLQR